MSEINLQFLAFGKLIWATIFALLYGLGGISGKWKRRFIAPIWMMLGIFLFSKWTFNWSYWYLIYLPLLIASLHLGYGGTDNKWIKIRKRFLYGLALGVAPASLAILNTAWIMWGLHISLCICFSVLLGVFNPTKNARSEETLIATASTLLPLFFV